MQEIIYQQRNAAKPLTGKGFVLSIAGIMIRLAIAQMLVNLLISLTGVGLLNVAFYLYAVWLLIMFMRDTVAAYVYTLKGDTLVLERRLGDSTITVIEIPLESVVSLREMHMGENLNISYRDVMHVDPASRPALRVRAAFALSLLSSHLARWTAGRNTQDVIGHVIVYDAGKVRCARTFCPDETLLAHLKELLEERYGFDERMTRARVKTLYSRALERAFPALYPYVEPLVRQEDVDWANAELARRKAARNAGKNPGSIPEETPQNEPEKTADTDEETGEAQAQPQRRRRKQG